MKLLDLAAFDPYALAIRLVGGLLSLALLAALVWWAVIKPRSDLADERAAHQATRAAQAETLAGLAAKAQAAAEAAARVRTVFETEREESIRVHAEDVAAAFERGKTVGAGIRDGSVRVRTVWRDSECPAADAGEGAGPGAGAEAVPAGRADAIGRVLGLGGQWDADYALCYARLKSAQKLLDQCHEEPAR